nr:hypothetical protein CFP56_19428 [Quercus suber]
MPKRAYGPYLSCPTWTGFDEEYTLSLRPISPTSIPDIGKQPVPGFVLVCTWPIEGIWLLKKCLLKTQYDSAGTSRHAERDLSQTSRNPGSISIIFVSPTCQGAHLCLADRHGMAQRICAEKNINIINAVSKFCQGENGGKIFVPSPYTFASTKADNSAVEVRITGTCDPPAYVPSKYCLGQFYRMLSTCQSRWKSDTDKTAQICARTLATNMERASSSGASIIASNLRSRARIGASSNTRGTNHECKSLAGP